MDVCRHCGAVLEESAARCPSCGAEVLYAPGREIPLDEGADAPPFRTTENGQYPPPAGPNYPRMHHLPQQDRESLNTLQYLLMLLLFLLPVAGFIALLVLSFTSSNGACRRLATAMVICRLVIVALLASAVAALWRFFSDFIYDPYFWEEIPYYLPWDDYYEDYLGPDDYGLWPDEDRPTAFTDRYAAAFTARTGYTIL